MLKDGRWIATEIFGLTDEKQIRSKMIVLAELARKGRIPHKRIGDRVYFDPSYFQIDPPKPKRKTEETPAPWLRDGIRRIK